MKTSDAGINLIKTAEGFSPVVYTCPAGKLTVGYGHVVSKLDNIVPPISEQDALAMLLRDLDSREAAVLDLVDVPLTQGQFDALVSFVYNLGRNALGGSTLLRQLNAGNYREAADQFLRWDKAQVNGRFIALPGLIKRRAAERALFLGGS